MKHFRSWIALAVWGCMSVCRGSAEVAQTQAVDLTSFSLEELMQVKVTAVSKKGQRIIEAPAAVHVLTSEDIIRSGYLHLPDLMRLVPGFEVARLDGSKWAVSSRGFNEYFANKLLVMVDGRSVYSPIDSGVFWDDQDVMLENIERIELVRGPGGTVWGANAVNGVINVITKDARETQGTLYSVGGGYYENAFAAIRHGWKTGDGRYARVYAKGLLLDDSPAAAGIDSDDAWGGGAAGFRTDSHFADDSVAIMGDVSRHDGSDIFRTSTIPAGRKMVHEHWESTAANLLGRWNHRFGPDSDSIVQLYYDHAAREGLGSIDQQADTFDFDGQYGFKAGARQAFLVGAGYRFIANRVDESEYLQFARSARNLNLYSMFLQDEITLIEELLTVTAGSKLEHNDFTGLEVQPGCRLLVTPDRLNSAWVSVARAVRMPSIYFTDMQSNPTAYMPSGALYEGSPATLYEVAGNPDSVSEEMIAYELGYRTHPARNITMDIAAFYNDYSKLTAQVPGQAGMSEKGYLVQQFQLLNILDGATHGAEASVSWQVAAPWRLGAGYTYFEQDIHPIVMNGREYGSAEGRKTPRHQAFAQSFLDVTKSLRFDTIVRYVDSLPDERIDVPKYTEMDLRLAWEVNRSTELSIGGQNLLNDSHKEFFSQIYVPVSVGRTGYVKLTLWF